MAERQPSDPNFMPDFRLFDNPIEILSHRASIIVKAVGNIVRNTNVQFEDLPSTGGGPMLDRELDNARDVAEIQS